MPRNRVLKVPGGILCLWGFQIRLIRKSLRVGNFFSDATARERKRESEKE